MSAAPGGATSPVMTTSDCSTTVPRITRTATDSRSLRGRTEGTLARTGGDRRQALRALLRRGRLVGSRLVALHQAVDRYDDEEVDDRGEDQERDQRVEEHSVAEVRTVDGERQCAKVRLAADGGEQRRDEALRERGHEGEEGHADDHGDSEVDDVAAQKKFPETAHGTSLARRRRGIPRIVPPSSAAVRKPEATRRG